MDDMADVLRSFLAKPGRKLRPRPKLPPLPKPEPWLDWSRLRIARPPPPEREPAERHYGARHHYRPTAGRYAQDGP